METNRSFLADGFGEFLFNNDEYLWNPLETYYKKRLLLVFPNLIFILYLFPISLLTWLFLLTPNPLKFLFSVQLMSILDHFGYPTKPLVEFNMLTFTDRASFMGYLNHIAERRRLEIILDPSASGPPNVKNKRVQVNMDAENQPAEPESPSLQSPSTGSKRPKRQASKRPRKVSESEIEEDTKSVKGRKKDKKGKGKSRSRSSSTKPNTSAYGDTSNRGGKHPKHSVEGQTVESGSDVDASHPVQQVDYEGHSDSLTDS